MIATKTIRVTAKAPNSAGTFTGVIDANPPGGDSDNERFADFANLPNDFPLVYQHTYSDPGAEVGVVQVLVQEDNRHLTVLGKLDLSLAMARAVHERMLLPSSNRLSLKELSVGFSVDRAKTTTDPNGVDALHEVRMLEVSIVYAGAQRTVITSVKDRSNSDADLLRQLAKLEREALDAKLDALAARPRTDAELIRELDRLAGGKQSAAGGNITPATASVLMTAANRLAQSAARATVGGLVFVEALLMAASRDLSSIASGGEGDIAAIIASVRPLVQELRNANQTIAASNLERDLVELEGGTANADPPVVAARDRYEPKQRGSVPVLVDARMRPVGSAAPVPTADVNAETIQAPVTATTPEAFRLPAEQVVSHRRET